MNCLACQEPVEGDELLQCTHCNGAYHFNKCLGIPVEYYHTIIRDVNRNWSCFSCKNITKRQRGDNTPIRRHYESSPPGAADADMSICDEPQRDYSSSDVSGEAFGMRKGVTTDLNIEALGRLLDSKLVDVKRDLHRIENKLSTTKQDIFNEINKEFNRVIDTLKVEFTQTTDLLSDQIKDLQVELSTVNKKMQNLEEENCRLSAELTAVKTNPTTIHNITKLEDIVDQMRLELNDRDQALLQNDVEITGVPEQPGESPLHITKAISLKLGMELEERDVISVDRVGQVRTTSSADGTRSRPRPLAVRLSRRTLRDDMLRNARVRRDLDTRDIGLAEHTPSRIFINERLTKINRQLFWKARQAANATGWKFVWTREGRIYAKQTDSFDSKRLRIHDEKEVERVFGTDRTSTNNK